MGLIGALALIGRVCHSVLMKSLGNWHSPSINSQDYSKAKSFKPALAMLMEAAEEQKRKSTDKCMHTHREINRGNKR